MINKLIISCIIAISILMPIHLIVAGNQFHIILFDSIKFDATLVFYIEHTLAYLPFGILISHYHKRIFPSLFFFMSGPLLLLTLFAEKNSTLAITVATATFANTLFLTYFGFKISKPFFRKLIKLSILAFITTIFITTISQLFFTLVVIDGMPFTNTVQLLNALINMVVLILFYRKKSTASKETNLEIRESYLKT